MISFSIKSVPNDLARELRARAARNHRSIQGELMDILEQALRPRPFQALRLQEQVAVLGVRTPAESTKMIRADRDRR
jgi:plasmid stability protein